jgi:hypothetical protein
MRFSAGAGGAYAVVLPRLSQGAFSVVAVDGRYAEPVLYEPDIPYARLTPAQRRELTEGARDGDIKPPPLTDVPGEPAIRRDLFVVPRR